MSMGQFLSIFQEGMPGEEDGNRGSMTGAASRDWDVIVFCKRMSGLITCSVVYSWRGMKLVGFWINERRGLRAEDFVVTWKL